MFACFDIYIYALMVFKVLYFWFYLFFVISICLTCLTFEFLLISEFPQTDIKTHRIIKQVVLKARGYVDWAPDHHLFLLAQRASICDEI